MFQVEQDTLRIGDLARRYGVCPESLRVWERSGLIPPAARTPGGHRRYTSEHLDALDQILQPLSLDPSFAPEGDRQLV